MTMQSSLKTSFAHRAGRLPAIQDNPGMGMCYDGGRHNDRRV